MQTFWKRARIVAAAGVGSAALSGCLNDPEVLAGISEGLALVAESTAAETHYRAQCHPRVLSGVPSGNRTYPDMLCPGDYGYNSTFVTPHAPAYHRRDHHHHDRREDRRERRKPR